MEKKSQNLDPFFLKNIHLNLQCVMMEEANNVDGFESSSLMNYRRGNRVEIASKEEGFVGSFYEAMIVTKFTGDEYIVTYDTLLKDDLSSPLREVVSVDEICPQPLVVQPGWFNSGDEIDAFDNDGWRMGKITWRIGRHYCSVHFECIGEQITYPVDRLRGEMDFLTKQAI